MLQYRAAIKFTSIALAIFCFWPVQAHADISSKITEQERAIFSFFKLVKSAPDYPTWVKTFDSYKNAKSQTEQEEIYELENLRLKWGFGTHKVEDHLLNINTKILLQLQKDKKEATLSFKFNDFTDMEKPIFPYIYGDELIALAIDDIEKFTTITLTDDEYEIIKPYFQVKNIYYGKLHMQIKPILADYERPFSTEIGNQWLMLGETAYLQFSYNDPQSNEQKVLWEYTAPWHVDDSEDILNQLLGN